MKHNPEVDIYIYHNNEVLNPIGIIYKKVATGYEAEVAIYECPYKQKCTKAKDNRKMKISKNFIEKRAIS